MSIYSHWYRLKNLGKLCPAWMNHHVFAEWVGKQYGYHRGFVICGDLNPNKLGWYSPQTAGYVPNQLACVLRSNDDPKTAKSGGKHYLNLWLPDGQLVTRRFDTQEEAKIARAESKVLMIREQAKVLRHYINQETYEKLRDYSLDWIDL